VLADITTTRGVMDDSQHHGAIGAADVRRPEVVKRDEQ
jgi:hypothetical protein